MVEAVLCWLFIGASALAGGLGTYVLVSASVSFTGWVYRRRRPNWLRPLEKQPRIVAVPALKQNPWGRLAILAFAVALAMKAAVTGGILVAVFLVGAGVALYAYLDSRADSLVREQVTDAVAELIANYYSAYLVIPTVFGALLEASKSQTNPLLKEAVQRALDAFGTGRIAEDVLDQLDRDVQNPYLSQFVFVLRHTSESNQPEILNTLRELSDRLDQRKRLKDRSRVALALVTGTVRFLQAANGSVLALAVLAAFWWTFYASSISHQAMLMMGGTAVLLGSWYFENQIVQLRERVL